MSVELATLTGLKNDLRTFGAATKEITGTAGAALSKGDRFYIGTDGNFYPTLGTDETKGSFTLDQQTGRVMEGNYNWSVNQDVNSNGWVTGVLYRSYGNTTLNTPNIVIHWLFNPTTGNITTQQIFSANYRSGSTSFNPYHRSVKHALTHFIDDTHFIILHDETYVNRDSSNNYNGGTGRTYAKVYSLNESTGATSLITSATNNYLSSSTSSGNFDSGFGYSQFWQGDKHTYWYKVYLAGTHYGVKRTVNPTTYALSDSTFSYSNSSIASRSSDHNYVSFLHNDTHNRTYMINQSDPSTGSVYYYSDQEAGLTITDAPSSSDLGSYGSFTLVDNLYVGGHGDYASDQTPKVSHLSGVMKVYEIDWTTSTNITWTEYPLEIGNFPFPLGRGIVRLSYENNNNRTWTKIGNDYYFIAFLSGGESEYTTENSSTTATTRYDLAVCKLTKDTVNSKYVMDFSVVLDNVTMNREKIPFTILKTNSDELKVVAYDFTGDGGGTGNFEMYEMVTYDVTPFSSANVTGQPVSGNIKADVASGATATAVVSGQLADIAVPVGTAINGWVGIGNNQAIKEG